MPVIDSVGRLITVIREPRAIAKYLSAADAEAIRNYRGRVCAIRLASFGDDRGTTGERHGSSLVTTERCKNEHGEHIGTLTKSGVATVLKHKLDRSEG